MADYIERAPLMGALTSSEAQAAIRAMTGDEAYAYFLGLDQRSPGGEDNGGAAWIGRRWKSCCGWKEPCWWTPGDGMGR